MLIDAEILEKSQDLNSTTAKSWPSCCFIHLSAGPQDILLPAEACQGRPQLSDSAELSATEIGSSVRAVQRKQQKTAVRR